jgi:hypothetical protein
MESPNDLLIAEKRSQNGEHKMYPEQRKKMVETPFEKISWPAIIAGVVVTAVSQMLLSLLGLGIGLGTVDVLNDPSTSNVNDSSTVNGIATGTLIWWSVSMLVSLFLGGLTAGKISRSRSTEMLAWNGFLTWCTFTVFSFFILTSSIGKLVSGISNVFGSALTGILSVQRNNQIDVSSITRDARNLTMYPTGGTQNRNTTNGTTAAGHQSQERTGLAQEGTETANNGNTIIYPGGGTNNMNQQRGMNGTAPLMEETQSYFKTGNQPTTASRESLVNTLVNETGMSRSEASTRVDQWTSTYESLKANAKLAADKAAKTMAISSVISFLALAVGALVTLWGARSAWTPQYSYVSKHEKN